MKIFISHAREDKAYGNALVELLKGIGLNKDQIIFTSKTSTGITEGEPMFEWLRAKLNKEPYVIFILSSAYFKSAACLNEMGAVWIKEYNYTTIFLPNFDFTDKNYNNCAIKPDIIGHPIDNRGSILQFVKSIEKEFELDNSYEDIFEVGQKFFARIEEIKKATPPTTKEPEQKETVGLRAGITPKKEVLSEEEKSFEEILNDIDSKYISLNEEDRLISYLQRMYFHRPNAKREAKMFMQLWPLVFYDEDDFCEIHREHRYKFLVFLFERNKDECKALIEANYRHFNTISDSSSCLSKLISFLAYNAGLYPSFKDIAGIIIERIVEKDYDYKALAWFLSESYSAHLQMIKGIILEADFIRNWSFPMKKILDIGIENKFEKEIINFILELLEEDKNGSCYYYIESEILLSYLYLFDEAQIAEICGMLNRKQRNKTDNYGLAEVNELRSKISLQFPNFDFSKYPKVFKVE